METKRELTFTQWHAYILIAQGKTNLFYDYCRSCFMSKKEIDKLLELI